MAGAPFTKEQQLAGHAKKKYRRAVASRKQWEALRAEKAGPCRCCGLGAAGSLGMQLHHVVPRTTPWFGDDTADNLVPLDDACHDAVTRRDPRFVRLLLETLTDAEYAYAVQRGGEDFFARYYRVEYQGTAA